MALVRSKSLPGVGGDAGASGVAAWRGDEESSQGPSVGVLRDSGVGVGSSENPSFMSDPRSSLIGELVSGGIGSEPPSAEAEGGKNNPEDETKRPTIGRHYYPEGGWGWLVLGAAFLVHILTHGLHQAGGTFLDCVGERFPVASPLSRGEYYYCNPKQIFKIH